MKKKIGNIGEEIGRRLLIDKGYSILFQNYRTRFGEIDIIAGKNNVVVFVEVKTRKSTTYGMPREAINYKKQMNYRRLAEHFIQNQPLSRGKDFRFDVIEIIINSDKNEVIHIENAF
ncbi:YraN family protein [Alkaliphilus peptidifermentans]|uniref:UPF0102 protein SAMN03080606_02711 n=1 Tax=Alkaliphilus peptidifermentans DSM 18978 TaxID=1120976 RepID=A0A1G5J8D0_9FIRM|nr:YraN family protein [Alkaliphilus peptidifermentans]SCY84605.1 putative endonuclease [Alkaliphilus peptidifermentans DSM 18978]